MAHLDPETLQVVLGYGFDFAVFGVVLYFLTSKKGTRGFRILPADLSEWIAYGYRLLEMIVVGCLTLAFHFALPPIGEVVLFTALFLLLASVVVFWRCEHSLSISAAGFLLLAVVGLLSVPTGGCTRP